MKNDMEKGKALRVASIDAMRALTMMLMLFVNDIPGLKGVPHGLFHAAADEDMLGFSDIVFPGFLFCVGMSVPFAIDNRLKRGDSSFGVLGHILWRSFALIVMGVFTLNLDSDISCMSYLAFSLLMIAGFFLIWTDYAGTPLKGKGILIHSLKALGSLILIGIIVWCHIHNEHFRTGWWGILGLIGWSYMVTSLVYLIGRQFKDWRIVIVALIVIGGVIVFVPSGWSGHALCIAGLSAAIIMRHYRRKEAHFQLISVFWAIGVVMLLAGIWAHQYWIISKIQGTPTWVFFCLVLFFPFMTLLYWLMDVKGHTSWTWLIAPAGTATLTCYLLPYVWYLVVGKLGQCLPPGWWYGVSGIIISLAYSLIIIQIARWMQRIGLVVKL